MADVYTFLNVTNGSINNIMPIIAPEKNHLAPLYYEDLLFLTEGFLQRQKIDTVGNNSLEPPPVTLYVSSMLPLSLGTETINNNSYYKTERLTNITTSTGNGVAYYLNPETYVSDKSVSGVGLTNSGLANLISLGFLTNSGF